MQLIGPAELSDHQIELNVVTHEYLNQFGAICLLHLFAVDVDLKRQCPEGH
jgi:hypothetical protein